MAGIKDIKEYEVIRQKEVPDLNSEGFLLKHKKSGARVFILSNDDSNKVFYIGFRTPPEDSKGTPHILEHSVLCGSKKFPPKDPFIELAKGSLNTFLNAMTYPDKTVYPVASVNDKDFANLMDVYMDAVLHPNIYERKEIFKQEGWHYEITDKDEPVTINGVVYNEMKGAYSSPDDVLSNLIFETLYPDTKYSYDSGGDPQEIPKLTYEHFIELHQKYYHPANSYIYLYGNCDMEEKLRWLDREYLSNYDKKDVDSVLRDQQGFEAPVTIEREYAISEEEELNDNTYLAKNYVVGSALDKLLYLGFQILEYALMDVPGAPLMQTLLDRNIGKDVYGMYENGIRQPYFSIIAKNSEESKKQEFLDTIDEVLREQVKQGIDKKALLAGINYYEFKYREADFGTYPKGLMYGLQSLDSWLYDDNEPFMHIEENDTFAELRAKVDTGYFEELIQKYLLDNSHASVIVMKPSKTLVQQMDERTAAELAEFKKGLSEAQVEDLIADTAALKAYQSEPSTQEELETIPLLEISDIDKEAQPFINEVREDDGVKLIYHDIFTNGIAYLSFMFDCAGVPQELLGYLGILKNVYMQVDTKKYSYADLNNEINLNSGGIRVAVAQYNDVNDPDKFKAYMEFRGKFLDDKVGFGFEMIPELIFNSVLEDKKRLKEIISMLKSRLNDSLISAGHQAAVLRAGSYISRSASFMDRISGIDFYDLVNSIEKDFDAHCDELIAKLKETADIIFRKENLVMDFTGGRKVCEEVRERTKDFVSALKEGALKESEMTAKGLMNEGIKTASLVQYVARSGNFLKEGLKYTGALKVLKVIMGYDYLWNNVRVKGGAYGCMSGFQRNGECFMVSYRDPHLKGTLEIFENAAGYIEKFDVSDRDMTKFIIGTVSNMDTPLTPAAKGMRSLNAYMTNVTFDMVQKDRDEVLSTGVKEIRALSKYLDALCKSGALCVIGGEEKIGSSKELFNTTRSLS